MDDRSDAELERWLRESAFGAGFALALDAIDRLEQERDRMRSLALPEVGWRRVPVESRVFRKRREPVRP